MGVAPHSAPAWMLTSGRTKSVQDAPTTNDHGCTEAKLSECPKGDRDREFAIFLKNKFFLQSEAETRLSENILSSNPFVNFKLNMVYLIMTENYYVSLIEL